MTWVTLPIPNDEGPLDSAQRAVMRLTDGETCRVRLADGEELEAICERRHGFGFVDDDGEPLEVVAVFARATSGTPGVPTKLERRLLSQSKQEFVEQDARAKTDGLSWSTWARRKLAT